MSIQKDRLHSCEQRIAAVQMAPPGLNHSDFWIGKEMDGTFEEVLFRDKIGVKDAKKLALRSSESNRKCAGFKPRPISAMDSLDIETALAQFLRTCCGNLARLIR